MGVTLPSIDRMLAKIDRALEPPLRLPAGGVVNPRPVYCWADYVLPEGYARGFTVSCSVEVEDWEATSGLCAPHYLEICGSGD